MSLGLPAHLAPNAVRRSFVNAQHTVAFTVLSVSVLTGSVFQSAQPSANLWPSLVALLPMLGLLLVAERMGVVLWSMTYLIVGGLGVHFYALNLLSQPVFVNSSEGFSFLAVKVALILVGGVVLGVGFGIAGAVAGYVTAELAVGLAQVGTDLPLRFEVAPFLMLVATITILVLIGLNSPRQMWALPRLQRAAQEEHLAALRYTIEVKAATLMHDTVLNHLAAIADSETDTLDPSLRLQIRRDVGSMTGEGWLTEKSQSADHAARTEWQHSGLFAAVQEGRLLGLDIMMTGDLTSVSRLARDASVALGLAVKQCLVNVLKHSGTHDVEVAVYRSESVVSVMVIDNGCGFVEAATGTDRLGLRSSVRKRIELVGGTVNVWSTPGRGTSIMIKVPVIPASAVSPGGTATGSS